MSYVTENLLPNEKVFFFAHIHPAVFLRAAIDFLAAILFLFWGLGATRTEDATSGLFVAFLLCIFAVFFLLSIADLARALTIVFTTEFAVTNKRVIAKSGLIRRRTIEILLSKVESVAVRQDILGRLMDYGTVTVVGTGGTKEGFPAIQSPVALRTKINQIIETVPQASNRSQPQATSNPASAE